MKCYEYNKNCNKSCDKSSCRYWLNLPKNQNCCLNAAKEDSETKFTLQDIGDIFNVTRMRICQIEKNAVKKIREKIGNIE